MSLRDIIKQDVESIVDVNPASFAVEAVHVNGAVNETLSVMFQRENTQLHDGQMTLTGESISIVVKTSDMSTIDRESEFTIDGELYYVLEIEPDIEGATQINITQDKEG